MPTRLAKAGWPTMHTAVKIMDRPMARVSSSFLALQAAAVAMAAETPQTDMSAEMVMFRVLDCIFRIFWPNQ